MTALIIQSGDRNIKSLKCKCDNSTHGCEWEGELRYIDDHSTTCEYAPLPCPNECKDKDGEILRVLRKHMEKHKNEECPRRQYTCPHCQEDGEYEEMTTQHLEECEYVEVPCPNKLVGCNELYSRCRILFHQRFVCQHQTVPCKYADIGCEVKMLRKDIKEHEKNSQDHLELAVKTAYGNKKTIEALEKTVKDLKRAVYEIDNAHSRSIVLLSQPLRKVSERLSDPLIDLDTFEYHLDQMSPNVLTFTNFTRRKSRNRAVYSPPFYSSPGGYKMRLRVFANGSGNGKGTHVSLFVSLMCGENDDHLTWPFTGEIKMELLNQLSDSAHHVRTICFMAGDKSSERVVGKDSAGSGYGQSKFISHSSLAVTGNPENQRQYLKDDCLYFRYKVTCEMPKPWLTAASEF